MNAYTPVKTSQNHSPSTNRQANSNPNLQSMITARQLYSLNCLRWYFTSLTQCHTHSVDEVNSRTTIPRSQMNMTVTRSGRVWWEHLDERKRRTSRGWEDCRTSLDLSHEKLHAWRSRERHAPRGNNCCRLDIGTCVPCTARRSRVQVPRP